MSVLGEDELIKRLEIEDISDKKKLIVTPLLSTKQVSESSINLRLGHEFILPKRGNYSCLDLNELNYDDSVKLNKKYHVNYGKKFYLHPNELVLAHTFEMLKVPTDTQGYVTSRSSWGRLGLLIATATIIHPGFTGVITLELVNHGQLPIALYPGLSIAQISFTICNGSMPYDGDLGNHTTVKYPDLSKDQQEIKFWAENIFN